MRRAPSGLEGPPEKKMKIKAAIVIALAAVLAAAGPSKAQDSGYDVFVPIAKYISQGDAVKLSAWFADNLEITVISSSNDSSKNQARQMLKSFFETYSPRSFEITHKAASGNTKYALGSLNAGGEVFLVTIFVGIKNGTYQIQQLKIERQNL